jgi:hypothetical protein
MKPSEIIDKEIEGLKDWRGKTLAEVRKVIHEADPEVVEEWKYLGTPCWSHDGTICVGNAHKDKVKLTFAEGANLPDPDKIFNNGFAGKFWRAIDLYEGDKVNKPALKKLVRAAVALNRATRKAKTEAKAVKVKPKPKPSKKRK